MTGTRKPRLTAKVLRALESGMAYVVETCLDSWGADFELTRGSRAAERELRAALAWVRAMRRHRRKGA